MWLWRVVNTERSYIYMQIGFNQYFLYWSFFLKLVVRNYSIYILKYLSDSYSLLFPVKIIAKISIFIVYLYDLFFQGIDYEMDEEAYSYITAPFSPYQFEMMPFMVSVKLYLYQISDDSFFVPFSQEKVAFLCCHAGRI